MPYPALPAGRRMHYEIDGTVAGYNFNGGFASGMTNILSAAQMLAFNEETPTVNSNIIGFATGNSAYVFFLFPELVDITLAMIRYFESGSTASLGAIQSSTDTTTGADGTWSNIGMSGTVLQAATGFAGDWWRSTSPGSLTSNNTGIKALRYRVDTSSGGGSSGLYSNYFFGQKHSGQTPNDIIFLQSDGVTEWTASDIDWGDVQSTAGFVTQTIYVKNTSGSLSANSVTVKSSGSDSGRWTVSLDNVSFASSQSVGTMAPGATQIVYVKFTPAAQTGGNIRPYAAYIEADVVSWS